MDILTLKKLGVSLDTTGAGLVYEPAEDWPTTSMYHKFNDSYYIQRIGFNPIATNDAIYEIVVRK